MNKMMNEEAETNEEAKMQASKKPQHPARILSSSHETMRSAVIIVSPNDTNVSSTCSSSNISCRSESIVSSDLIS